MRIDVRRIDVRRIGVLLLLGFIPTLVLAQLPAPPRPGASVLVGRGAFTRADSLRGGHGPYRTNYDVRFYDLRLRIDPATRRIAGSNQIVFTAQRRLDTLQIDLFEPYVVDSVLGPQGRRASVRREGRVLWVTLAAPVAQGATDTLTLWYQGTPQAAKNPPWDGGFVWRADAQGRPWVGVACQGLGASAWWPLKDDLSDEPDSMRMSYLVPQGLMAVGNGQLRSMISLEDGTDAYEWFVSYPINSYNVTVNVADYAHLTDTYEQASGEPLQLDYYVLRGNEAKARRQFAQVQPMLQCFEARFGPYPFARDGYALVETAYYGMEHQGAIAYGAGYENTRGYPADYIIVHESGHEWFGNLLSMADNGDMWIHESFTTYSEAIYLECTQGRDAALAWLKREREYIANEDPIQGPRGVNFDGWNQSDMYYKGAWMLHTLRQVVGDTAFGGWLRALVRDLAYRPLCTEDVIAHANGFFRRDLGYLFAQYLYHTRLPRLELSAKPKGKRLELRYRWVADMADFRLPVALELIDAQGQRRTERLSPTTAWQTLRTEARSYRLLTDELLVEAPNAGAAK